MDGARRGKHGPKPNENKKNKKSTSTGKQRGAVAVVLIQVVLHRTPPLDECAQGTKRGLKH